MEIPSWAFASAGQSLAGSVSELERNIIPEPDPEPVPAVKIQEPAIDTLYDEIIHIINDMLPERNAFVDMLIELYT
jgi:hypothetical protein